jgi:hypothetical protein
MEIGRNLAPLARSKLRDTIAAVRIRASIKSQTRGD